jgi:pimeloyl-ACP methyl ester carboxylesterase
MELIMPTSRTAPRPHVAPAHPPGGAAADPAPRAATLVRPGGTLAYEVAGSGPLVVLLPGLGQLRSAYRHLVPELVARGFRTVSVDLRGHGASSVGWPAYGAEAMGPDVAALIEALGGPALVVGNSYGAGPAVWAAAERPDLVAGVVLTGPFVRPLPMPWPMRVAMRVLLGGPWRVAAWDAFTNGLLKAGRPDDQAAERARLRASLREPGRIEALAAMLARDDAPIARDEHPIAARLERVRAPSLVLMGTADPDFPDPMAEACAVADAMGGRAEALDGVGHYPHLEVPGAMAERLAVFAGEALDRGGRG